METLWEMARDLSHDMQNDERFVRMMMAQAAADEDKGLQDLIGEFNLKRLAMNGEMNKEQPDKARIEALEAEARDIYGQLMANPHMTEYQKAKTALDTLVNGIVQIITQSAQGHDPDEIEPSSGCGGDCASCGGCH